jgi:hypothetical protein
MTMIDRTSTAERCTALRSTSSFYVARPGILYFFDSRNSRNTSQKIISIFVGNSYCNTISQSRDYDVRRASARTKPQNMKNIYVVRRKGQSDSDCRALDRERKPGPNTQSADGTDAIETSKVTRVAAEEWNSGCEPHAQDRTGEAR